MPESQRGRPRKAAPPEPAPKRPLTLRLPPAMREALDREAAALGVGLVALCTMKLATPLGRSVTVL
jgi:hypothetical protein